MSRFCSMRSASRSTRVVYRSMSGEKPQRGGPPEQLHQLDVMHAPRRVALPFSGVLLAGY